VTHSLRPLPGPQVRRPWVPGLGYPVQSSTEGFLVRTVRTRVLSRLVVALAVPVLLAAGCANADPKASSSSPAELKTVKVTEDGAKPKVSLAKTPTTLATSGTVVLKPGAGAVVGTGQRVTVDYLLVNGKDGKEADTSFGKKPVNFVVDPKQLMPGLAKGLVGQKVGSRVLVGVSPKDGFVNNQGQQGNQPLGFGKDDALLFVMDIKAASTPLKKATGDVVKPKAGLPTVKDNGDLAPTVTVSKAPAPKKTLVQTLIKGKGPALAAGQTVAASYVGALYGNGKVFDSSYKSGRLLQQVVGSGQLIPGMDKGLVGQTVGSRVLLVVPPAEGYGKGGQPQAGIKGTDSLVFVVDILDAY
jgi:peptidylprolyl isomerase